MDIESYILGSSYTNEEILKVNQTITNVTNQVTSGIKSITQQNGNQLVFTLNDNSIITLTVTGLSSNDYTSTEKNKLASLNSNILSLFTYVNGQLLFNNEPIANSIVDLSNYYNKSEIYNMSEVDNLLVNKANLTHVHALSDITDILLTSLLNGQTIVYDSISGKFINGNIAADGTIKMDSSSSLNYLNNLIDGITIQNSNGKLITKSIDGMTVSTTELNYLAGLNQNIMTLIGNLTNPMTMLGVFDTYALLIANTSAINGSTAIVKVDENNSGSQMMYLYIGTGTYSSSNWIAVNESSIEVRNFTTNPINLTSEVTGVLPIANIDTSTLAKTSNLTSYLDKATYDSNSNGIVDKAETLDGLTKTVTEINNAIDKANTIVTTGDGTKFKADDGTYKTIANSGGSSINDLAETSSTTETYSVNKINSLITEVNNTNFTNANNAKSVITNAIGDVSLTISNTFAEISNSLLAKKQNIVTALANKGIGSTQSDDISSYATKINSIVQNSQIKNTKLNKTAGSTYQVILTNPTTLQNICTSVLEYQVGTTGVVRYDCAFNNADSTSFNTNTDQHMIFDGTMHQDNNIQSINMTNEGAIDTYTAYSATIDKTQFYKINNIAEANVSLNEVITVSGIYTPTLVQANSDISLSGIDRISNITWTATSNNTSKLLLIYSLDSGITWKGYDSINHVVLNISDISNLSEIQSKGISITNMNALTQTDLDNIRNSSTKIRFAYYFEKNSYNDTLINDEIILKVDMTGNDVFSTHYNVTFDGSKTITYTFTANGTYTIVYTDNN